MRLLADEHVPPAFISALRGEGHDIETHPGVLACDTAANPGEIAAAVRRIEAHTVDLTGAVLFVPGNWP